MKPISYEKYFWQNDLVRLRASTADDWEDAYPNYFDSQSRFLLQEEMELPPVIGTIQENSRRWAGFSSESDLLMFTIETLDGTRVGGLNLNSINERRGTFGIGIQVNIEHRGKGYGISAMRILLRYAFLERRLNKFNSGWLDGNPQSETMHKRLGCVDEGVRRQMSYSDGQYVDWFLVGLTKDEFVENERKFFS